MLRRIAPSADKHCRCCSERPTSTLRCSFRARVADLPRTGPALLDTGQLIHRLNRYCSKRPLRPIDCALRETEAGRVDNLPAPPQIENDRAENRLYTSGTTPVNPYRPALQP